MAQMDLNKAYDNLRRGLGDQDVGAMLAKNPAFGQVAYGDPTAEVQQLILAAHNEGWSSNKLQNTILDWWGAYYHAFAAAAGLLAGAQEFAANDSVTLYGPTAGLGVTYPGGVPISLYPRQTGVPAASPGFQFKTWMFLLRITATDADIARGWSFVGNSVTIGTDPVNNMNQDTGLQSLAKNADPRGTPLASLYNRAPTQDTTLTMQVIHSNAIAQPFDGIEISYYNNKCPDMRNLDIPYNQVPFEWLMQKAIGEAMDNLGGGIAINRRGCGGGMPRPPRPMGGGCQLPPPRPAPAPMFPIPR